MVSAGETLQELNGIEELAVNTMSQCDLKLYVTGSQSHKNSRHELNTYVSDALNHRNVFVSALSLRYLFTCNKA